MADGITRSFAPDPKLDLVLERVVEVPPELVWAAWTQPEHLKVWFTPAPWRTTHCEIDLRPGGIFRTVMEGPAGERFDGTGCYLEVVPNRRLVWTSVLLPHWRPAPPFHQSQDSGQPGWNERVRNQTDCAVEWRTGRPAGRPFRRPLD